MANPVGKFLLNIDGQGNATNLTFTKDLDTLTLGKGRVEKTVYFKAGTNTPANIIFTKSGTLSTLIITSSSTTEVITMTINVNDGVLAPYTIVIPFIEFGAWNFGSTFFGYITSIDVSTVSTSFVELQVRAYA